MKKTIYLSAGLTLSCLLSAPEIFAQGAIDAFRFAQPDMKGTARFMSMGGAFGALGGDLSTLSQNPGGIGVYRNSEVGITFDLDFQNSSAKTNLGSFGEDKTKFWVNNVGAVWTLKLNSKAIPNINLGFTYNKATSFSRRYKGSAILGNSLSNYMAAISNSGAVAEESVAIENGNNPWESNAPWLSTLAFQSYLMWPYYYTEGSDKEEFLDWEGQWIKGKTSGIGVFNVEERGSVDEYNIALGGNINNVVYWGMDFGITSLSYKQSADWGENLKDAWVNGMIVDNNQFLFSNQYSAWGTGFNYKIGVIVKPIQELRLGFAVHTPTWYNLSESYIAGVRFPNPDYGWVMQTVQTNNGVRGSDSFNFKSPMKLMASIAGVIKGRFIISADYEWSPYDKMKLSESSAYDYYYGYPDYIYPDDILGPFGRPSPEDPQTRSELWENYDAFYNTNKDIKEYFRSQHTLRLGAEYRVTSRFSVRAGYSYVSSPTTVKAYDNQTEIFTSGVITNYRLNNETNYITCGLGYKVGSFYIDAAYVYKHLSAQYRPYPAYPGVAESSPRADLSFNDHQIFLSCGFKF